MHAIAKLGAAGSMALGAGMGGAQIAPSPPAGTTVPYVTWAGDVSGVAEREFARVRDEKAWASLWARHAGAEPKGALATPQIDFSRCEVVAFFRGKSMNRRGEFVESIAETPAEVRIRFASASFQTAGPGGGGVSCVPFGVWVIQRTRKPILIEENVQDVIGGPPVWKQQHRFPSPGDGPGPGGR